MEQNSTTYSFLLRIVFFGSNRAIVPPVTPDRSMPGTTASASSSPFPNRSIFCYKTEIPGWPPISVAEFEDMLLGVVQSQPKAPLKVLDAPTLLDDFFGWFCQKKKTETTLMFHKHSPILHKQEEKNIHGGIEEEKGEKSNEGDPTPNRTSGCSSNLSEKNSSSTTSPK